MAFTKITAAGIGSTETVTLDGVAVINNESIGGNLTVTGNATISGVLTYEDVTNVDSVGLITARNGIVVGSGITLSKDGDIFATGIVTASSFVGSGAELTGVASTENIRTNTNATFLQNVTVVGTSTVTGNIVPSSDSATDIGTNSVRFQNAYVDTYYGDGSNLTGIAATANVRTGILDVAGIATFRSDVNATNINGSYISGRRNLLINGAMKINQREQTGTLGYFNPVTSSIYTLDRWKVLNAQSFDTDSAQVTQDSSGPASEGFRNSIMMNIGNTETPGTNQVCGFEQKIEAQDLQHLKYGTSSAETMTLSFWVYSNKTGTYSIQLIHEDVSKYVLYSYTIDSADTWEKKTITISGNTSNNITDDNGIGLIVTWVLCAGSGRQYSATDSWSSGGSYYAVTGQVNLWDHADNYFKMTGCQLEIGTTATEFEHRSFGDELTLCMRYYEGIRMGTGTALMRTYLSQSNTTNVEYNYKVEKRIAPTWSLEGNATWYPGGTNGMSAYPSRSSCIFQRADETAQFLNDAHDDLCGSFSAEL